MPEISRATGIAKDNLYKWERGAKPSDVLLYNKLNDYLDKVELAAGDGSVSEAVMEYKNQFRRVATMRVPLEGDGKPAPYLTGNIAAGTVVLVNEKPELIVDRIDAQCLGEVDGLVEITNESMEPTFSKGSRIAITRLKNQRLLDWGECYYLIDKNWQSSIKRIYPGESSEKIQLVSDNPDRTKYPPYEREWSQIETICKVKAEIKRR
jgi:hypothetical protein